MYPLSTQALIGAFVLALPLSAQTPESNQCPMGRMPLASPISFVANNGQWPEEVLYRVKRGNTWTWLTRNGWTLALEKITSPRPSPMPVATDMPPSPAREGVVLRMTLQNLPAHQGVVRGEARQDSVRNFFLGQDPKAWRSGVPCYGRVRYSAIQEGIDLVLREDQGGMEYDLSLQPRADLSKLVFRCEGQDSMDLDAEGNLVLRTRLGDLRQSRPIAYEIRPDGSRRLVDCRFRRIGEDCFGFWIPDRSEDLSLLIDPGLVWSTFLSGSSGDTPTWPHGVTFANNGDVIVCGSTYSTNFPTTPGAWSRKHAGSGTVNFWGGDGYVTRFTANGSNVVWSTLIGGRGNDRPMSVEVMANGDVLLAGWTYSANFPTTSGVIQPTFGGAGPTPLADGFLSRLAYNPKTKKQTLTWSTYLGRINGDAVVHALPHPSGMIVLGGWTANTNFPIVGKTFQPKLAGGMDAFIVVLLPTATKILQSTYLGGNFDDWINGLAIDNKRDIVFCGDTKSTNFPLSKNPWQGIYGGTPNDGFLGRIPMSLATLSYSSYFGGKGTYGDTARGPVVDSQGRITVAGWTDWTKMPTTATAFARSYGGGARDGFLVTIDPRQKGAAQLAYSTFLGGSGDEGVNDVKVDRSGFLTVTGSVSSRNYPTTPGALDRSFNGPSWDGFVTRLDPSRKGAAQLVYSTFLGGGGSWDYGYSIAINRHAEVVVTGPTSASNFPTKNAVYGIYRGGGRDGFVTLLDMMPTGATPYGKSNPLGSTSYISVNSWPMRGNVGFELLCSGISPAALNRIGFLLLGLPGKTSITVPPPFSFNLYLQVTPLIVVPMTSSPLVRVPMSIPSSLGKGSLIGCQFLWTATGNPIFRASNALQLQIQ